MIVLLYANEEVAEVRAKEPSSRVEGCASAATTDIRKICSAGRTANMVELYDWMTK